MTPVPPELRQAVTRAIARTDAAWHLHRERVMDRTRAAVMAAIEPIVAQALSVAHIDGVHQGVAQGRTQALHEAATMLKRHGHRTAVTRVLELADAEMKTPARPQPVHASPAGGPGKCPNGPDCITCPDFTCALNDAGAAPEPTDDVNGAQRGGQSLQAGIDAASAAERERRERDAWIGHAPQQAPRG